MKRSVEEIPLSEIPESSFAILSKHLDTSNPRRRDWRTVVKKINLDMTETKAVEMCNEHCRKLIEIWSQDRPLVKDLLEILEEMGCPALINEIRQDLERHRLSTQGGVPIGIAHPLMKEHSPPPMMQSLPTPISNQYDSLPKQDPLSPISNQFSSFDKQAQSSSLFNPFTSLPNPFTSLPKQDPLSPVSNDTNSIATTNASSQETSISDTLSPTGASPPSQNTSAVRSKEATNDRLVETREDFKKGFYVSYHENDSAIGQEIIREMEARNVKVFSNEDVLPGDVELIKREDLFKLSRSVFAVITPDYYRDEGFHRLEAMFGISGSLSGSKQTLIPVLCRKEDDAPVFITSRHSIKWDDPQKFNKMFKVAQKLIQ